MTDGQDKAMEILARQFKRHVTALNTLLKKVKKIHPDANYYLAMESLHIIDGDSHDGTGNQRQDRSLASETLWNSGGGDW